MSEGLVFSTPTILLSIFKNIQEPYLFGCRIVCKKWNELIPKTKDGFTKEEYIEIIVQDDNPSYLEFIGHGNINILLDNVLCYDSIGIFKSMELILDVEFVKKYFSSSLEDGRILEYLVPVFLSSHDHRITAFLACTVINGAFRFLFDKNVISVRLLDYMSNLKLEDWEKYSPRDSVMALDLYPKLQFLISHIELNRKFLKLYLLFTCHRTNVIYKYINLCQYCPKALCHKIDHKLLKGKYCKCQMINVLKKRKY